MMSRETMRTQGKITHWNEEKGYGFITPSAGAKQVFLHISDFRTSGNRPAINQLVSFVLSSDRQGRPCAIKVRLADDNTLGGIKQNDKFLNIAGALLFLVFLGALVANTGLPVAVWLHYLAASVITYLIYLADKSAARKNVSRISERNLHLLALLGGWPGAMIAQQTMRHKSAKESFRSVFWITVLLNCGILAWLFTDSGAAFLKSVTD